MPAIVGPVVGIALRWIVLPLGVGALGIWGTSKVVKSVFPEIHINKDKVGIASLLGGAGIASYFAANLLPENWRWINYIVSVGGVSYAAYLLFDPPGGPSRDQKPGTVAPERPPQEETLPTVYGFENPIKDILTVKVDPAEAMDSRSVHADQEFRVIIKNKSDKKYSFYVGLHVYQPTFGSRGIVSKTSRWQSRASSTEYNRKYVTFLPEEERIVKVKMEALSPFVPFLGALGGSLLVGAEIFRIRDANYVLASELLPVTFGPIG